MAAGAVGLGLFLWSRRAGDSLAGRTALVTGGSRGLGYLIAERLLGEGCRVVICGRDEATLERAQLHLERDGGTVLAVPCDVADPEQVCTLIERIEAAFGGLDILVNNAAIIRVGPLEAFSREDFDRVVDIGFWGTVNVTMAALPMLRRSADARIANITSIGGKLAVPHLLPYECAKFAVMGFSEGLAAELAADGIRVTTVVPGLMRTGSPVHVEYHGDSANEYRWFVAGDLLPVAAMSATRAADRIVRAIRRGETEVTLTWQAKLIRVAQGLAPGALTRAFSAANRLLPENVVGARPREGTELRGLLPSPLERWLDRSGERSNQFAKPPTG